MFVSNVVVLFIMIEALFIVPGVYSDRRYLKDIKSTPGESFLHYLLGYLYLDLYSNVY